MAAPAVKHDPSSIEPPTPKKGTYGKRQRLPPPTPVPKPRSAGFVLRSRRSNTADFSEYVDVQQTDKLIRKFFDESRQGGPQDEPNAIHTRHQHIGRQIKRLLQIHPSSDPQAGTGATIISSRSMVTQQTPNGQTYGQIVTCHPYDVALNVSTYDVNKMRRTASTATQGHPKRNRSVKNAEINPDPGLSLKRRSNGLPELAQEHPALEVDCDPQSTVAGPQEPASKVLIHRVFNSRKRKEMITPTQIPTDIFRPCGGAPVIPSPRKSVLHHDLGFASNWTESFSASQEPEAKDSPSQLSKRDADNEPIGRDFAIGGADLLQRLQDSERRSCSPEKGAEPQDVVAGLSHNYPPSAFPSFRQRIEEYRAINTHDNVQSHTPQKVQQRPSALPSSANELVSEGRPRLKPSPIIQRHSKQPSVISAETAAEDVQSDASSGVVSNAQSAVFMRGQIATDHSHTRKPSMPGPPPIGALPSLPEVRDGVAPATPRFRESSQRVAVLGKSPGTVAVPTKSPKRPEYRFVPSDCSPPKVKKSAPLKQSKEAAPEQLIHSSTQIRTKREGLVFLRSDQLPKSVSADDMERWQQQRNERTNACKSRDLARNRFRKATKENVDTAVSGGTRCEKRYDDIEVQPITEDSSFSSLFSARHGPHTSQATDLSPSNTMHHGESSALFNYRKGNTISQRLSPIMLVAEQIPIPPNQSIPSQLNCASHRDSINEETENSRFDRDHPEEALRILRPSGFQYSPSHPPSPSLQSLEDQVKARPISAHSMTATRPLASRTTTPFMHSLLRAQSNQSSHRTSMHEAQVSDLEARLSAIEKKNVMLERAFFAVINTSAPYGGFDGGGGPSMIYSGGEEMSNGGSSDGIGGGVGKRSSGGSVTESLYVGLENLLALHASEVAKRLSMSSEPP